MRVAGVEAKGRLGKTSDSDQWRSWLRLERMGEAGREQVDGNEEVVSDVHNGEIKARGVED